MSSPQTRRILSIQSHVVHGYVGNKSAVFPLQLLGFDVDPINSVQFCNHTGYPGFRGQIVDGEKLWELFQGLESNGLLEKPRSQQKQQQQPQQQYSHVLTGYIGSESFLKTVARVVQRLREIGNSDSDSNHLIYCCDPVLGDNGRFYMNNGTGLQLLQLYRDYLIPEATILTPNQFECEQLTGMRIESIGDACRACEMLHEKGPKHVVLTTLDLEEKKIMMLLSTKTNSKTQTNDQSSSPKCQPSSKFNQYLLTLPKIATSQSFPGFTGSGDLTAALLLGHTYDNSNELPLALEKTGATMQSVLRETMRLSVGSGSLSGLSCNSSANSNNSTSNSTSGSLADDDLGPGGGVQKQQVQESEVEVQGEGLRVYENKTVPPELKLIQSKRFIENPKIKYRCKRIYNHNDLTCHIQAVVFDLDGTLTLPHQIDFAKMRKEVGMTLNSDEDLKVDILKWIQQEGRDTKKLMQIIEAVEADGELHELQPDTIEVLEYLRELKVQKQSQSQTLKIGMLTKNSQQGVKRFFEKVGKVTQDQNLTTNTNYSDLFDLILTRDESDVGIRINSQPSDFIHKPSGDGLRYFAEKVGIKEVSSILMVGDSRDDMKCATDFGGRGCYLSCDTDTVKPTGESSDSESSPDVNIISNLIGIKRYIY